MLLTFSMFLVSSLFISVLISIIFLLLLTSSLVSSSFSSSLKCRRETLKKEIIKNSTRKNSKQIKQKLLDKRICEITNIVNRKRTTLQHITVKLQNTRNKQKTRDKNKCHHRSGNQNGINGRRYNMFEQYLQISERKLFTTKKTASIYQL